ncbi:MAG: di-heme oxidoredictase family protein [Polyangiales bacterium]
MVFGLLPGCGGEGAEGPALTIRGDDPSNLPLASLTEDERARFDRGDPVFARVFRESQGLGPLYIRASCASCHASDGRGPGAVERVIAVEADGFTPRDDQSAMPWGPVLRPFYVSPATRGVEAPEALEGALRSRRVGPAVFGRGWMEAVDPAELTRLAFEQARGGELRGRVPWLADGSLGRFGLKSRVATLEGFAADALRGDMGITSPALPDEVPNPDGLRDDARPGVDVGAELVRDLGGYLQGLAIPARRALNPLGRSVFERIGCAGCHAPSLATRADAPVRAMRGARAEVYSDLLLHDMGAALADGAVEGAAGPRDWRTAPLIGLRFFRAYLHDGRARTLDDATRMHRGEGSEANASVDRYAALTAPEREALVEFLRAL